MFQKSGLLKCIGNVINEHSLLEQTHGLYSLKSSAQSSRLSYPGPNTTTKCRLVKSSKEWRDSFKKSFNSTFKKSYRKIKNKSSKKPTTTTTSSINEAKILCSTLAMVAKPELVLYSSDSDDSDIDISLNQSDYDMNSSLSSVSSLEFESFECPSANPLRPQLQQSQMNQTTKKSIVKPPLISSSRSNITNFISCNKNNNNVSHNESNHINFNSCATSSRLSLLSSNNSSSSRGLVESSFLNLVKSVECCSVCNNNNNKNNIASNHQICSSTMINTNSSNLDLVLSASRVSFNSTSSSLSSFSSGSSISESSVNCTAYKKF